MSETSERIVCSAILANDGKKRVHQPTNIPFGVVVCGLRHSACFELLSLMKDSINQYVLVQGFITNYNRFLDREEALRVAKNAGQLRENEDAYEHESKNRTKLYSEDLY